ncbi:hypothetical protein F5Y00DRAFT_236360 [Daldinia vernicosa]|uniref:uncharacterized protein n=1 Tax=Daldinia vernicosa TaxID=114800 RepID=UPI0020075A3F|nr:uncharacterized protein F5Y00DRAFT_236360 [Daldinia vernicosa]KAI0849011.1 hypothetical protein F5Y00DRAFT_236360 [Daldinia vernicosa]
MLDQAQSPFFSLPGEIRNIIYKYYRADASGSYQYNGVLRPREVASALSKPHGLPMTCKLAYDEAYEMLCAPHAEITAITYPDFRPGSVRISSDGIFQPSQLRSLNITYIYDIIPSCDNIFSCFMWFAGVAPNIRRLKITVDHGNGSPVFGSLVSPRPEWIVRGSVLTTFNRIVLPQVVSFRQLESVELNGRFNADMAKLLHIRLTRASMGEQVRLYRVIPSESTEPIRSYESIPIEAADLELTPNDENFYDTLGSKIYTTIPTEPEGIIDHWFGTVIGSSE